MKKIEIEVDDRLIDAMGSAIGQLRDAGARTKTVSPHDSAYWSGCAYRLARALREMEQTENG